MRTWNVTVRPNSILGVPLEVTVTAEVSRTTKAGTLEFWLTNHQARMPDLVLLRAFPAGTWLGVQLETQSAESKEIGALVSNVDPASLGAVQPRIVGGKAWVPTLSNDLEE